MSKILQANNDYKIKGKELKDRSSLEYQTIIKDMEIKVDHKNLNFAYHILR